MPILNNIDKLSKLFLLSASKSSSCRSKLTRQIHANNLNQSQLQNSKKREHYYKSLLNDFKHKNVNLQNYRIAMTLIGKNNDLNRKRISTALEAKQVKQISKSYIYILKIDMFNLVVKVYKHVDTQRAAHNQGGASH